MSLINKAGLIFLCSILASLSGTPASGAEVETLLMPGQLVEAHSELETDCAQCHAKFDQSSQRTLCLDCHEDVAEDLATLSGFHGVNPAIKNAECTQCHGDHQGRSADIIGLVPEFFDHSLTNFSLSTGHQQVTCSQCHETGEKYRDISSTCSSCHAEQDPHQGNLGQQCDSCHTPTSWSSSTFDHYLETQFSLSGAHADTSCSSCHADETYETTETQCIGCHEKDDVHDRSHGTDCASCHNPAEWQDAKFDHKAETDFALVQAHAKLTCDSCHLSAMSLPTPPTTCIGCHASIDAHQGQNGSDCKSCHSQTTWNVTFDHFAETGFQLEGAHKSATCSQCHAGALTVPIESACYACHVVDDPHGGELTRCESCHGVTNWLSEIRFHHELTGFPLLGGHQLTSCEQCHNGLEFTEVTGGQCVDCHQSDDPHEKSLGTDCATCHSPVAWALWTFDHNTESHFKLDGAHQGLECAACHTAATNTKPPSSCAGCHRPDDPHRGSFGNDCLRCHSTTTFQ